MKEKSLDKSFDLAGYCRKFLKIIIETHGECDIQSCVLITSMLARGDRTHVVC